MKKIISIIKICRLNKPFLALPFVVTITFSSSFDSVSLKILFFNLLAVISGFMIGNVINGIADKNFDSINPRTIDRPLVNNELSDKQCLLIIILLFFILIFSTYMIDPIYIFFLPIPALLVISYSFLKRITWLCHVCLGLINGAVSFSTWGIIHNWLDWEILLAGAIVFFWTIGFEILYSCQDYEIDKKLQLHSIPVHFGIDISKKISLICTIILSVLLMLYWFITPSGFVFAIGICIGLLITYFQTIKTYKDNHYLKDILTYSQLFSTCLAISAYIDYIFRIN